MWIQSNIFISNSVDKGWGATNKKRFSISGLEYQEEALLLIPACTGNCAICQDYLLEKFCEWSDHNV
jgi:hypothetical protein